MNQLFKAFELTDARLGLFRGGDYTQDLDAPHISSTIKPTELEFLLPVFGYDLYEDFLDKRITAQYFPDTGNPSYPPVDMFPNTLVAYNELFNLHIWGFFGQCLAWRLQTMLTAEISNKGTLSPERLADLETRIARANLYNKNVDILRTDMVRYLCKNKDNFPLWSGEYAETCKCACTDAPPKPPRPKLFWS
jgi:hypothetical protein